MSTPATTAHAPVGTDHRAVPAQARQLAARLSALFDRDVEIVKRLNDAHQRLANANQQLDARTASDTLTLPDIRWRIHHAFCAYQDTAEQRRQLAVDVGEIAQQLTDALTQAGWTAQQARRANVHQLAEPSRARVGNFHDREWGFPVIVDMLGERDRSAPLLHAVIRHRSPSRRHTSEVLRPRGGVPRSAPRRA